MSTVSLLTMVLLLVIGVVVIGGVVLIALLLWRSQSSGSTPSTPLPGEQTRGVGPAVPSPAAAEPIDPMQTASPEPPDVPLPAGSDSIPAVETADQVDASGPDGAVSGDPLPADTPPESVAPEQPEPIDEPGPSFGDEAADSTPLYRALRDRLDDARADTAWPEVTEPSAADATDFTQPDPATRKEDELMSPQQTEEVLGDVENVAVEESDADEFPVVRVSDLDEVVDGGYGIGSAAPIADGAQPLGHPIKANIDTKTYQDLHSPWYAKTQPDVWFLDVGFAERAGFHRAE